MRRQAIGCIGMEVPQCTCVKRECALCLIGSAFEKRIDERRQINAEILEDQKAARNIAGQKRCAVATAWSLRGNICSGYPLPHQA